MGKLYLPIGYEHEQAPELTKEDILRNPEEFGFCSFEDFCKDPKKWTGRKDEMFDLVFKGDERIKAETHYYYWRGDLSTKTKSLEAIERLARNEGYDIDELDFDVAPERTTGGKYVKHVRFMPKEKRQKSHLEI